MAFSEVEKINIRKNLLENCESSWSKIGYKRTNIEELCRKSGISKGSFYLFYESKEDLFCDVMLHAQEKLVKVAKNALGDEPTKEKMITAFQLLFREYNNLSFALETQSPDFIMLMNKLTSEKKLELDYHGAFDIKKLIAESGLEYQIDEGKSLTILALIFRPLPYDNEFPYDAFEATDYMIKVLVNKIFH